MELDTNGFVGPFPRFASDEEIDGLRAALAAFVVDRHPHPLYGRFSARDYHLVLPSALALLTHAAIVSRLRDLMGDDLILWRSKVFHKEPGAEEIGWHQEWGWFNGEEIGNDRPSLVPSSVAGAFWNLTVWVALDDIAPRNGALQFVRGSHQERFPIAMVPMVESAFFQDPFLGDPDTEIIVRRAKRNDLLLDIDTTRLFDGVDPHAMTRAELKQHVARFVARLRAAVTLPFEVDAGRIVTVTMPKGAFLIFTERTMHRSLPNDTACSRTALSCRVTTSDTLVYPGRLRGEPVDGSNLDITRHRCVLLSGSNRNAANVCFQDSPSLVAGASARHPILGRPLPQAADEPHIQRWELCMDARALPELADHRVLGSIVVPGTTYVNMALAAAEAARRIPWQVEEVVYTHPMTLTETAPRVAQVVLESRGDEAAVRIFSRPEGEQGAFQLHARLMLRLEGAAAEGGVRRPGWI